MMPMGAVGMPMPKPRMPMGGRPAAVPPVPPVVSPPARTAPFRPKPEGGGMGTMSMMTRKSLPKSDFAVPGKAPGSGSYPIPDASHARNALARASQFGSPAVKSAVKRKVAAKFPQIGQKSAAKPEPDADESGGPMDADQDDTKRRAKRVARFEQAHGNAEF